MIASRPHSRSFSRAAPLVGVAALLAAPASSAQEAKSYLDLSKIVTQAEEVAALSAQGEEAYSPVFGPAIDWSVLAQLTESFELDHNRQLDGDSGGVEARGALGLGINVSGAGKRTQFSLATGFNVGRATDGDSSNLNRLDPNISASAVFLAKNYSISAQLSALTRPTSVSELEETGLTNVNATRIDVSSSVGINWSATKQDSFSLTASAQVVDFSRSVDAFTPSQTVGLSGGWSHQATKTTSYSFSTSFRHFEADGANGRTSQTASAQVGIQHSRTSRHTLGGSAGFNFTSSDEADGTSSTQVGFVGSGSFSYAIDELSANLGISQSVQPSSDGELRAFTALNGSLSYRINALQSLDFGVSYTRRSDISGGGDVLQFLSLGPTYSYSLSKNSSLSLGYQFRVRDDVTNDFQTGHQVSLRLSHALTLLP